jgi:hypothetical protein
MEEQRNANCSFLNKTGHLFWSGRARRPGDGKKTGSSRAKNTQIAA